MRGSGPNGELMFQDVFEGGLQEGWEPRYPDRVREDVRIKNKFTKRGLARLLHEALEGHVNGPYTPSDITSNPTNNCFQALVMFSDSPSGDGKDGDARVEFDESDGAFVTVLSADTTNPGEGRRGVLLSDTAGILRRLSIAYVSTNPYGEAEFVFYAQPNTNVKGTATMTMDTKANHPDGETFTLDDGFHPAVVFEIDTTGDGITLGRQRVKADLAVTADDMRDAVILAVNECDEPLDITASIQGSGVVLLTNDRGGALGNTTIVHTITAPGFGKTDFASGSSTGETGDKGLDNFPIQAIGLATGVACGSGEADSEVGIRAISGLAPTLQCVGAGVVYHHEVMVYSGSASPVPVRYLHPPAGNGTGTITGDGFVYTSEATAVQIGSDIAGDAGDSMNSTSRIITLKNANFKKNLHVRKTLRISNSGTPANNQDYTIKRVIAYNQVEVFEAIDTTVTENFMTTGDGLYTKYTGDKAFDGRVENLGRVETSATEGDRPGTIIHGEYWESSDDAGPHVIGRIWSSSKTLIGCRICVPAGINKDFVPNRFKIDILNPAANGGNPRPGNDSDWVTMIDNSGSDQATLIFDSGVYGYEYTFTPTAAKGIRLSGMQAFASTRHVQISTFMAWADAAAFEFVNGVDKLRFATDAFPTWREYDLPTLASTQDQDEVVDALNTVLRGYELEAVHSPFHFLWLRGTVAGNNSQLDIDSEGNGSTANSKLGLATGAQTKLGITQPVLKWPDEALTIIYRVNLTGNVPGGYA